jgi:CubicO group peptidase (beta-lactamase class C family)
MILTEEGRISPNTRVCEIIPEFKGEGCGDDKRDIFLAHLLTHTSGLVDDDVRKHVDGQKDKPTIPPCEETQDAHLHERLCLGYEAPLSNKIGTYMSYSSYGYELLGEVVRRVSGESLQNYFSERIFGPLGMKDTHMIVPESVWDRVVKPREDSCAKWQASPDSLRCVSASGGTYSTAYDIAVFGQMFLNGGTYGGERILSRLSVRAMTQNHTQDIPSGWGTIRFPQSGWGLGFMISLFKKDDTGTLRSPETYSHTGYGCTYLAVDPVNEVVMTCFQITTESPDLDRGLRRFDIFSDVALAAIED